MKIFSVNLRFWSRLLGVFAPGNTRTTTAALLHPPIDRALAWIAATTICGVLGGISLVVPPFITWDSAHGFLAWRGTVLGAMNCSISPNPENIAQDMCEFMTWWSPGQYLVPGTISLLGVPLGIAMTLTVALALLASLIGWVMVARVFAPQRSLAALLVGLIGSFPYSTLAFLTYHGGEILLQAGTPWLVLTAYLIPEMRAVPAGLLAAGAVCLSFLAKLTGLLTMAAALLAGSLVFFVFGRRVTYGMIGGALGAMAAFAVVYFAFLSRGSTPAVQTMGWSLPLQSIALVFLLPWVAGISWSDALDWIFPDMPSAYFAYLAPAVLVIGLIVFWRPQTTNEKRLRLFCLWFYGITTAVFIFLYIHGSALSLEERHFRSVGTLLFVCAVMSAMETGTPRWAKSSFLILCALMAFYGVASFSYQELQTARGNSLDRMSWTNQRIFDPAAIEFAKEIYVREGHDALFVLPSPQMAVTLPTEARVFVIEPNSPPASQPMDRYFGRVRGHLVVIMPNTVSGTRNSLLLSAFRDYVSDNWTRMTFPKLSVFLQ